jgi:hypothetical protein
MSKQIPSLLAGLLALCFIATAPDAQACKVPVFRYALEHWPPDSYRAVILHRGELSAADEELVLQLEARSGKSANLVVERFDLAQDESTEAGAAQAGLHRLLAKTVGQGYRNLESTQIVLFYPEHSLSGPLAWQGPLTAENIDALLDSPARRQIAKWILDGESAVWVLVKVGDPKQDAAAEETLRKELARLQKELKLADIEVIEAEKEFGENTKVELRLGFKLLVLDRNDPLESVLAETLLRSEDDLMELKEPVAIPVFGRGRSHLALVGKGINPGMIEESCRFLTGDCSCEVKRQNPGVDLVFDVDWDELVVGSAAPERELPPLSGVGLYNEIEIDVDPAQPPAKTATSTKSKANPDSSPMEKSEDRFEEETAAQDIVKANEDKELAHASTAPLAVPPKNVALKNESAGSPTDSVSPAVEGALEISEPFGERVALWLAALVALGAVLVVASMWWLRSQAKHR